MNPFKKLGRDSLSLLIARVGALGSMIIITYLLARRLGTTGFGEYAFIATAIVIGNTLTTFGSDMVLIREIASKDDFSEVPSVLVLQLILSSLFIGILFVLAPSLPNQTSEGIRALNVYSFALIPLAFFTIFTSVLRGVQRMTSYAWLNLGVAVLQAAAIAIFIQRGTSILRMAYLLLAVQIAGAMLAGLLCSPHFSRLKEGYFSLDKLFSLFFVCLPVASIAILGILYQRASLAMLTFLGSYSMAGLFSIAARVMEAAHIGHIVVFTALYPAMAKEELEKLSTKTFRFSLSLFLVISILGSIFIFLLAKPVVNIFFGTDYRPSIPVLKILSFTLIPYTISSYLSLVFLARRKEKIALRVLAKSLLMLLILNIFFIPLAGHIGASLAVLIAEIVQAILFIFAWINNPFRQRDALPSKGVSYELSDLS